jgi:hypothetical protein
MGSHQYRNIFMVLLTLFVISMLILINMSDLFIVILG